jgi:hypothetical protein
MSVSINFHYEFGLANRLFIFATAYAYAKKYKKKLVFLHEFYHHVTNHSRTDYTHIFFADIPFDTVESFKNFNKYNETLFCKYNELPIITNEDNNNVLLLSGCFQSEKYFKEYSLDLYKRFGCSEYIKNQLINFYPELNRSCFIHVRRGDYTVLKKYDLNLFENYYPQAISQIRGKFPDIHFYVLSNDIEWCKNNDLFKSLKNDKVLEFIDSNEVIGLWFMQNCKYGGICANSTYSWWGGWLNKMTHDDITTNTKNSIIFPSRIMNDDLDYTDLISEKFEVIQV